MFSRLCFHTFFSVFTIYFLISDFSQAKDGGNHGGGSSGLVSHFRDLAERILNGKFFSVISIEPKDRQRLLQGLSDCDIVETSEIVDPVTRVPIDSRIIKPKGAWGYTGSIQLKNLSSDPLEESWEKWILERKPIAHHIYHELDICTWKGPGKAPDNDYKISMMKYGLHELKVLTGPDISAFDCHVGYKVPRNSFEIPDSRKLITFNDQPNVHDGVNNLKSVSYDVEFTKTQKGMLYSLSLKDKRSGVGSQISWVRFNDDDLIILTLDGITPDPEHDRLQYLLPYEKVQLYLACFPVYPK